MKISAQFATSLQSPTHVAVAEELGYDRAWLFDTPHESPDVWMMLTLAAKLTATIGLGPGVLVPTLRHPAFCSSASTTFRAVGRTRELVHFLARVDYRWVHWQPTELVAGRRRSVSGVEFYGHGCWAGDSGDLLPGCGSAAVWVGHAARDDGQGFGEFESGEVRAEAVVHAAAEGEHGRRPVGAPDEIVRYGRNRPVLTCGQNSQNG
jgi:Luciferase-like monooxygenase